jgi:hypothetical protein
VFIRGESVFVYGIGKNFATESHGISRNLMQEFKYFRFLYFPWKSVFIRGESVFVYGIGKNFATESRGISRNLKANLNVLSVEIRVYPWLNGFLCSSVANRFILAVN